MANLTKTMCDVRSHFELFFEKTKDIDEVKGWGGLRVQHRTPSSYTSYTP